MSHININRAKKFCTQKKELRCRDTSTKVGRFCQYLQTMWKGIKEGRKSDRQLLLRNGRVGRWVAFKLSIFSCKKASTFFFFLPLFKLPSMLPSSNSLSPHVSFWSLKTLKDSTFFFSFKLKRLTQKRLPRFYLVTFFFSFFFPLS